MIVSEYTNNRAETLNKMFLPQSELPINLKILWIETVDKSYINGKILKQAHEHSFFEVHCVFSGAITYECNGNTFELGCGQAILIPAHTSHRYITSCNDVLKTAIAFSVDKSAFELLNLKNTETKIIDFSNEIAQSLSFVLKQSENKDIFTPFLIAGRAVEILYSVFRKAGITLPEVAGNSQDPRFLVAKAFIESNCDRIITCNEVASECCLSAKQLNRIFKAETEKTLSEYIIIVKVNRAKKLLLDNQYSIKEIGFLLGFGNESSFVSFFKRHCGIPPGLFRRQMSEK